MTAPRWVPVAESLPPRNFSTLLWGSLLEVDFDDPLMGRICACHGQWVLELYENDEQRWEGDYHGGGRDRQSKDAEAEAHLREMLGEVTHWLDWRPGPETLP